MLMMPVATSTFVSSMYAPPFPPFVLVVHGKVVPSLSMVLIASPDPAGTAWLHRLVYLTDTHMYDLVPEYRFPLSPLQRQVPVRYCGAVVQPLRFPDQTEEGGVEDGGMGVMVVSITVRGHGVWWTVKKGDEDRIGVEGIVL